jgi:hypothetical protein
MGRFMALPILILWPLGCGQSPAPVDRKTAIDLTAEDLAHASDVRWWYVNVPEVPEGKVLCLAFVDDQGIIESRACPEAEPGGQIKLVLSGLSDWDLRYSLVTESEAYRSTISNHLRGYDGPTAESSSGKAVNVGEFMMKKSNGDPVAGTDHVIHPLEIALTFTIQDEAQLSRREGYRPPGRIWLIEAQREAVPVDSATRALRTQATDDLSQDCRGESGFSANPKFLVNRYAGVLKGLAPSMK